MNNVTETIPESMQNSVLDEIQAVITEKHDELEWITKSYDKISNSFFFLGHLPGFAGKHKKKCKKNLPLMFEEW